MIRTTLFIVGAMLYAIGNAQPISVNAKVLDEKLPKEAARNLETKLQSALTANG